MTNELAHRSDLSVLPQICNMAFRRTDIEEWSTNGKHVVNLARMDDADESFTQNNHLKISGRERTCKPIERLVGFADDVRQIVFPRKSLYSRKLATSADKSKSYRGVIAKLQGCVQDRIQRVQGAVIAGIHDNKFIFNAETSSKEVTPFSVKVDCMVERPYGNDVHLMRRDSFGDNTLFHKSVEDNNT